MPVRFPDVLHDFNIFVRDEGQLGLVKTLTPPKRGSLTEEHRAAGMPAAIKVETGDVGPEFTFKMCEMRPLIHDCLSRRNINGDPIVYVVRQSLQKSDDTPIGTIITMRGIMEMIEPKAVESGTIDEHDYTIALDYYQLERDGQVLDEFDILNMKKIISGTDVLQEHRTNIGFS